MTLPRSALLALGLSALATAARSEPVAQPESRWWRGNLHTHTLWSDGDGFPEMVVGWYRDAGYNFLALSDHNVLSRGQRWIPLEKIADKAKGDPWRAPEPAPRDAFNDYLERYGPHWVETRTGATATTLEVRLKPIEEYRTFFEEPSRFLLIEAEEITHQALNKKAVHMNATNMVELLAPRDGATVRELIQNNLGAVADSAAKHGREIMIHVNHPNYKWGITAEDLAHVVGEQFFEVWNGVANDNDPGDARHPSTDEIWDIANTLRLVGLNAAPLYGLATDDSHDYQNTKTRALPGRAWVMVRARHLTPESIIRALRAGDFYASSGVELDQVKFDDTTRTLSLSIRPCAAETFVTRFIGTRLGVKIEGRPRLDPEGRVIETTLDYHTADGPQIGEVLAEVTGLHPAYTFRGDELYVRAVITSSGTPAVPSIEAEFKRAWTQPVGWRTTDARSSSAPH